MVPYVEMPLGRHCNGSSSAILLVTVLLSCSDSSNNVGHTNPLIPSVVSESMACWCFFFKKKRQANG